MKGIQTPIGMKPPRLRSEAPTNPKWPQRPEALELQAAQEAQTIEYRVAPAALPSIWRARLAWWVISITGFGLWVGGTALLPAGPFSLLWAVIFIFVVPALFSWQIGLELGRRNCGYWGFASWLGVLVMLCMTRKGARRQGWTPLSEGTPVINSLLHLALGALCWVYLLIIPVAAVVLGVSYLIWAL